MINGQQEICREICKPVSKPVIKRDCKTQTIVEEYDCQDVVVGRNCVRKCNCGGK